MADTLTKKQTQIKKKKKNTTLAEKSYNDNVPSVH